MSAFRASASPGMILSLAAAFIIGMGIGAAKAQQGRFPQDIQIDTGRVSGIPSINPAVMPFKAIPFAAPPVRDLRLKPPVPPANWGAR